MARWVPRLTLGMVCGKARVPKTSGNESREVSWKSAQHRQEEKEEEEEEKGKPHSFHQNWLLGGLTDLRVGVACWSVGVVYAAVCSCMRVVVDFVVQVLSEIPRSRLCSIVKSHLL